MDLGLRGRTAIVAAASQGLGKGVARALAAEGANVVMFSRTQAAIESAAADVQTAAAIGARVVGLAADVTRTADLEGVVKTTLDSFGSVDVLFNNAGGPKPGMFDTLTDDDWQGAVDLNLMSAIRLTRLCLPSMRAGHWGRVITSTSSSVKQPLPTLMLSNAVRSATTAWSKTLSDQVAADGITVNTLAPGRIETERIVQIDTDLAQRTGRSRQEVERDALATIPLRRYGRPEEFGAAAAFLASEQASYITGVTLLVDGGLFRGTY
ncbi:MAG TPA: SDR family oxidoreductase [Chloroflexota bacterium]|nr:SDR family oxidoreductase [Chloroflexota bacterium]